MNVRTLLGAVIATLLLAGVLLVGPANTSVAHAGSASGTAMACGDGHIVVNAPTVTTQQGWRGGSDIVHWRAELWYFDNGSRTWQPWEYGPYRTASVQTNAGPTMGTATGWAGPTWYGQDGGTSSVYFKAARGPWWAIRQVVYDRGDWIIYWAYNVHAPSYAYCST